MLAPAVNDPGIGALPFSSGTDSNNTHSISSHTVPCPNHGDTSAFGCDLGACSNDMADPTLALPANASDCNEIDNAEFEREMRALLSGNHPRAIYSRKVFLGGLPLCTNADDLRKFFSRFGDVDIIWPHGESFESEYEAYGFAIFFSAEAVISLVNACVNISGRLTISVPVCGSRMASIHVRTWLNANAKYCSENYSIESIDKYTKNSVFVGGLPRTVTARELFHFMSLEFGDVVMAQIEVELETDYPKGAGCVVFRNREAFLVAIARHFTIFSAADYNKRVELKPYLIRFTQCDVCQAMNTRDFCPSLRCLKYMCEACWRQAHMDIADRSVHTPMIRAPPLRSRIMNNNSPPPWNYPKDYECYNVAGVQGTAQVNVYDRNSRRLFGVVNSLPVPPTPLLELESESQRDWNTDCGMFDMPPQNATSAPRSFSNASQQTRSQHETRKTLPRATTQRCGSGTGQRTQWDKSSGRLTNSQRAPFSPRRSSHTYYNNSMRNTPVRSRPSMEWNGGLYNTANYTPVYSSSSLSSDRALNESFSRSDLTSQMRHVRVRTSFSPTIRRPARRHSSTTNAHCQERSSNAGESNSNVADSITSVFSQFKLF